MKQFILSTLNGILVCNILMVKLCYGSDELPSDQHSASESVVKPEENSESFASFSVLDPTDLMEDSPLWESKNIEEVRRFFPFLSRDCFQGMPLNFGVVINNERYQLYRSQALGEEGVERIFEMMHEHTLNLPAKVVFMNKEGYAKSSLSRKLSEYFDIARGMGPFAFEEESLFSDSGKYSDVEFYHPLSHDVFLSGQNPLEDVPSPHQIHIGDGKYVNLYASRGNFFKVLDILLKDQGSSLFHCTGGLHRTGMISLALRHIQGGVWLKEFKKPVVIRTKLFWQNSLKNLAEVEYYLHNPMKFRMVNINAMRTLVHQPEFEELKTKYKNLLNLPSKSAARSEILLK